MDASHLLATVGFTILLGTAIVLFYRGSGRLVRSSLAASALLSDSASDHYCPGLARTCKITGIKLRTSEIHLSALEILLTNRIVPLD